MNFSKFGARASVALWLALSLTGAQTLSSAVAEQVMLGNYDPANYYPPGWAPKKMPYDGYHQEVLATLQSGIGTESLKNNLVTLTKFHNRNTGSDTLSNTLGMGATRRWLHAQFTELSQGAGNRMLPAYLTYTGAVCNVNSHRNTLVVMPGMDKSLKGIVLLMAHVDSRCEVDCDITCRAHGADDNASGSVLVLELARVLARTPFNRTVVFMLTTGEEQGLSGARAFATYAKNKGILIHAVQNNDINGGIVCGTAPSPPGCTTPGSVDSTSMRVFSVGDFNSPHKGLARWVKLQYMEKAMPTQKVPMNIKLMLPEDRTGRGGDHIPFGAAGFTAIRLMAANENNRTQHTVNDSLIPQPAWWNHLARQTLINGLGIAMAATGPAIPTPGIVSGSQGVVITMPNAAADAVFRVGIRTTNLDFDKVLTWTGPQFIVPDLKVGTPYSLSVTQVVSGVESLFSGETRVTPAVSGIYEAAGKDVVKPWRVRVSPAGAGKGAVVTVKSDRRKSGRAYISVSDAKAREVYREEVELNAATQEFVIPEGRIPRGAYTVSLTQGDEVLDGAHAFML